MEQLRIEPSGLVPLPGTLPPAPAVMAILNRFNRDQIGNAIEVLVALLDTCGGDPDLEDATDAEDDFNLSPQASYARGPGCHVADPGDIAATEWQSRGRDKLAIGIHGKDGWALAEDAEDDDADHGLDEGEPNFVKLRDFDRGAGCSIADPGGCEHDGREEEHDAECEQMPNDVPVLPVYSAEHNVFNDQRTFLGMSNLQSSFVCGGAVKSADTGKKLTPRMRSRFPGVPV